MSFSRTSAIDPTGDSELMRDGEEIKILWLGECEVGSTTPMMIDLGLPGLRSSFRRTTVVVAIEPIDFDVSAVGHHDE